MEDNSINTALHIADYLLINMKVTLIAGGESGDDHEQSSSIQDSRLVPQQTKGH